jgi:hypothetical protein
MCLYPKLIKNPRYKANNKNGGRIPELTDKRALVVPASCGKCMECRRKKTNEWKVRLQEDIKVNTNGKFVTLTFSEQSLSTLGENISEHIKGYERENQIAVLGVRRFLERWRKKYKKSVRHWLVTELGQNNTERIHIHGIIWTDHESEISRIWKYGNINIGSNKWKNGELIYKGIHYCNAKSVNYMVKYLNKADPKHKEYRPKTMTSPNIGGNFLNTAAAKTNKFKKNGDTKLYYKSPEGTKIALPQYYRMKLYNDDEREKLWMEMLDKEVRYINGNKIDISKGNDDYFKTLKVEQQKNKRLGYGDNSKNWQKKLYEEERRQARIDRVKFGTIRKKTISDAAKAESITIDKKQDEELVNHLKSINLETIKNIF